MKPRIVLLVGLPGSGKSTFVERNCAPVLSSDAVRGMLADDPENQNIHGSVFRILRAMLRERIAIGRPVTYVDATNLTRRERRPYLLMAQRYGAQSEAIFFDVPLEICKQRNRARARVVPDEVMDRMARKLQPPSTEEGFAKVTVA